MSKNKLSKALILTIVGTLFQICATGLNLFNSNHPNCKIGGDLITPLYVFGGGILVFAVIMQSRDKNKKDAEVMHRFEDLMYETVEGHYWPRLHLKVTDSGKNDFFLIEITAKNYDPKYHIHNARLHVGGFEYGNIIKITDSEFYADALLKIKAKTSYSAMCGQRGDIGPMGSLFVGNALLPMGVDDHRFSVDAAFPKGFYKFEFVFKIHDSQPFLEVVSNISTDLDTNIIDHQPFLEAKVDFKGKKYWYVYDIWFEEVDAKTGTMIIIGRPDLPKYLFFEGRLLRYINDTELVDAALLENKYVIKKGKPVKITAP